VPPFIDGPRHDSEARLWRAIPTAHQRRTGRSRLERRVVTADQARLLQKAISNYREIQALLARWEDETASEILDPKQEDPRK
jgi:hypothetical protein